MKTVIHDPNGREIWCYGGIREDSNFSVVCEDEWNDVIVPGIEGVTIWQEVVDSLFQHGYIDMEEITSC